MPGPPDLDQHPGIRAEVDPVVDDADDQQHERRTEYHPPAMVRRHDA